MNTKRYVSVADMAKELRKALKAAFPGQKFSVTSKSYSGGASIHVGYINVSREYTPAVVREVCAKVAQEWGEPMPEIQISKNWKTGEEHGWPW